MPINHNIGKCGAASRVEQLRANCKIVSIRRRYAGTLSIAPLESDAVPDPGTKAGLDLVLRSFRRVFFHSLRATLTGSMPACFHHARSSRTTSIPRRNGRGPWSSR
jgi:hypothetical protein